MLASRARFATSSRSCYGSGCSGSPAGYADANDAARIADDPMHKLLADRDPIAGEALASQPTLSRFENRVRRADLFRMADALADTVIAHHRRRLRGKARRITIDMDPTDDPTHGQQELAFYNGHYDSWCYLPMVANVTFGDESEQYLVAAVLRPGNAHSSLGAIGILRRLIRKLRTAFPKARLRVRLDGGFATPEIFDFLEDERIEYLVAMAKNKRLGPQGARLLGRARAEAKRTGQSAAFFGETRYAARKWTRGKRRVIYKAEVVCLAGRAPLDNLRFVVTNLPHRPERIYDLYRQRGDDENRIKELHYGLELDRTSCHRFLANQLRVLMTAAAYVWMQELRRRAKGTSLAAAQVTTLRERLFRLAAWFEVSTRRIVVHLPRSFAWKPCWLRIAARLHAAPG
ncbi:MAG: IS1380 family transposase [Acidimicrobiia bacterium]|nr:IS1380 family transposase [Acidimicrobiia bacterium]